MKPTRHLPLALLFATAAPACGGGDAEDSSTGADTTTGSSADEATDSSTDSTSTSTDSTSTSTTGADEDCGNGIPVPGVFCFELETLNPTEMPGASSVPHYRAESPSRGVITFCDGEDMWTATAEFGSITDTQRIDAAVSGTCGLSWSPGPDPDLRLFRRYDNGTEFALVHMGSDVPEFGPLVGPLNDKRSSPLLFLNDDAFPDLVVEPLSLPGEFELFFGDEFLTLIPGPTVTSDRDIRQLHPIALEGEMARSIAAIDNSTGDAVILDIDVDANEGLVERYRYSDPFDSPFLQSAFLSDSPRPELLSISLNASAGYLTVLLPTGDASWEAQEAFPLPGSAGRGVFGDFDGDGDLDFATSGQTESAVYLVEFEGAVPIATTTEPFPEFFWSRLAEVTDLNADGVDDVIWWDAGNDQVVVFRSNP